MGWVSGLAVYLIIWWLVLFMVLPWGVRPVDGVDVKKGQDAGAPKKPRMLIKAAATTVVAGVIWGIFYWAVETGLIAFH